MKHLLLIGFLALAIHAQARADLSAGLRAMDVHNYAAAVKELTPAAESGDAMAQFNLAKIYLYGWGVKKNEAEAAKWFRKAAEQGDLKAGKMLAYQYERGIGVEKNPAEAEKWRHMATAGKPASAPASQQAIQQGNGKVFLPNMARKGRSLSQTEVAALEQALTEDQQNDPVLRAQLLGYYYHKAITDIGKSATIQARRRHILWIIENQPGSELASLGEAGLVPSGHALADKEGYERAKALWLKQAEIHKNEPKVLLNAASFLQLHDKPLAENLLKTGETLNPQDSSWKARRGYLYALAILGIDGLNTNGIPISVNRAEQNGNFAHKARKEVETSANAVLIGTTGAIIAQYGIMVRAMHLSASDYSELGEQLLLKAQSLEPGNASWSQMLGEMYNLKSIAARTDEDKAKWTRKSLEQMEKEGIAQTADPEARMSKLGSMSKIAFEAGEYQKADKYARDLLAIAEPHPKDPRYGQAWHDGNMVLGRLALKRGDATAAKAYLLKAGHTPGGGTLSSFGPNMSLAKELLAQGEKSTVLEYLRLCKKFWTYPRNPLDKWIQAIEAGQQPDFAQNLAY